MGGKSKSKSKAAEPVVPAVGFLPPKAPAPKPDPKDFCFVKRRGEVLIKRPGQVNGVHLLRNLFYMHVSFWEPGSRWMFVPSTGLDFVIDSCLDCTIYILDYSAQLQVRDT